MVKAPHLSGVKPSAVADQLRTADLYKALGARPTEEERG